MFSFHVASYSTTYGPTRIGGGDHVRPDFTVASAHAWRTDKDSGQNCQPDLKAWQWEENIQIAS